MDKQLVEYFQKKNGINEDLNKDTRLFSSGLIDSFGVLELIVFLEETFNIEIDTTKYHVNNFDSIKLIQDLLTDIQEQR